MIDIHCHILPGIDDGAKSLEESVDMARHALQDGITGIIATPHHVNGKYMNPASGVRDAVALLNGTLQAQDIPLQVYPGQEIRIFSQLSVDRADWMTLNDTPYVLIEFPFGEIPRYAEETFHELRVLGLIPIIAHPERYQEMMNHPERLQRFISAGALAQVTSHSVTGALGKKIQSAALQMCKQNLIHFVSSDAHDVVRRPFGLREAYHVLDKQLGASLVSYYKRNAEAVWRNESIETTNFVYKNNKWYNFWKF